MKKNTLIAILIFVITILATIFLQEPLKLLIAKFFFKKEISYEIISTSRLTISELENYAKSESLPQFNLNLDDSILHDYYLFKLRLKNKGIPIENSLKFKVFIGKAFVKILDIKYRVEKPSDKVFKISNSIPNLVWSSEKEKEKLDSPKLTWKPVTKNVSGRPTTDLDGYNIYRSKQKGVGGVRVNDSLVKDTSFDISSLPNAIFPAYFYIEAVDLSGNRSKLSNPKPFPEILAFQPIFKNVVLIEQGIQSGNTKKVSKTTAYSALAQAIKDHGNSATYIVNEYKADSLQKLADGTKEKTKVLYLEDMDFLSGKAEIFIASGLDENAEIIFYFLCKILPEADYNLSLKLEGNPELKIKKITSTMKNNFDIEDGEADKKGNDIKYMLTPRIVIAHIGKDSIFLSWELPSNHEYKGVRIFRTEQSNANLTSSLGKEIYKGSGKSGIIECDKEKPGPVEKANTFVNNKSHYEPPNEPPARGIETVAPAPPIISIKYSNDSNDSHEIYFADTNVSENSVYIYTIYAYDNKNNYSYPIVINASLRNFDNGLICHIK